MSRPPKPPGTRHCCSTRDTPPPRPRSTRASCSSPRRAKAGFAIGEHRVEPGDLVLLSAVAANLDEAAFPDAREFGVHRDATGHLAFGDGPYDCLGAPPARLDLQAVFTALPRLVPDGHFAVPAEEPGLRADAEHAAFAELPLTW
ncbi:cytochrome P450 [Amycolatopsis sp. NPDC051373]|uniref:cytochrome P450 n=1 Tax=Amycolatopsis sp. NPDC051373 TaxID=3155801 RepID=UPI0034508D34